MTADALPADPSDARPAPVETERFRLELQRYLRWLGADAEQAADLAQDAIVQCWRTPPQRRDDDAVRAWLRTVARNRFVAAAGRVRPGVPLDDVTLLEAAWRRFCERDADGALGAALGECLEGLPERSRHAIELHYRHGLGQRELAGTLGLSTAGVKALLRRTRAALADCIERRTTR